MQWIERCLNSIPSFADVFIIDNGSTDCTQDYIKNNFPNIMFFQSLTNLGFGTANNVGLQYAINNNYDYVYLLNQDAWIEEKTIEHLIQVHQENPSFGILSPMQCQKDTSQLDNDFKLIFEKSWQNQENVIPVNSVMAAHWLISRECLLKVGGFSPSFKHYGEDDNYCDRVKFHKMSIGIDVHSKAIHDRADRITPPEKQLYLDYVRTIVYLSDFKHSSIFALYGFICDSIKYLFKQKKWTFLSYIAQLVTNYPKIKRNKIASTKECAFLNKMS